MRKSLTLVLALCLLLSAGCQKKDEDTPVATPPPAQGDASAGFTLSTYVVRASDDDDQGYNWKKEYLRFKLHKGTTGFTEPCTAELGEDIVCILEADEEDLYYFGTAFQYNIPPDMCDFVHHRPYLFYGLPAGTGPTSIHVDTVGAQVGSDLNDDGDLGDPGELTDPSICTYNYSASSGPNCCEGTYTRVDRTWNGASYDITAQTVNNSWGGEADNCIDGPTKYLNDWPKLKKTGRPLTLIKWVYGFGDSSFHEIKAPMSPEILGPRGTNVFAASWYDIADHGGSKPTPILNDGDEITCRDRDSEILARITLYIRDWNTKAAWDAMVDNPNDHSLTGPEDAPYTGDNLNDYWDWKDLETSGYIYPGLPES